MAKFTFTTDSFTCNGKTFPARYEAAEDGAIFLYTVSETDAEKEIRIRFDEKHTDFPALRALLNPETSPAEEPSTEAAPPVEEASAEEERPAAVPEEAAPVEDPQPAEEATQEAPQPRQIPEKTFIGESITGKGWKIFFDGHAARTRVIFENTPTDAARAAVEKAGFYFSAAMDSWNKKLTFKAYRAAQALAGELSALYA